MNKILNMPLFDAGYVLAFILVTLATSTGYMLISVPIPFYMLSFGGILLWYIASMQHFRLSAFNAISFFTIETTVIMVVINRLWNSVLPLQPLTFIFCFLILQILRKKPYISKEVCKTVLFVGCCGAVIFCYAFWTKKKFWFRTASLTIGTFNPQSLGSWSYVYSAIILLLVDYLSQKRSFLYKLLKLLLFAILAFLFLISMATLSRAASAGIVLLVLIHFLPRISFFCEKHIAGIMATIPPLVVIVSLLMYKLGIFVDAQGVGFLDGRENLWMGYLEDSLANPFWGIAHGASVYTHNIFLDHILLFGYLSALLFITCVGVVLRQSKNFMKTRFNYDAYAAFVIALLQASIEGMFFSTGGGGLFLYSFSFLFFTNNNFSMDRKTQKLNIFFKL